MTFRNDSSETVDRRVHPYAGGFVLAEEDLGNVAHYSRRKLANGLWWWSDSLVREEEARGAGGDFLLIRGHWALAATIVEGDSTAAHLLAKALTSFNEFEEELELMSGRYVIVVHIDGETFLYNDMIGARTVYYSPDNRVASSHLRILTSLAEYEVYGEELLPAKISWAADFTPVKSVWALLPNYKLQWSQFSVNRFFPIRPNRFLGVDREEKLAEIERLWHTTQEHYMSRFPQVCLALSGGIDSRLVLAMTKPYWDQIVTYTYGIPSASESRQKSFFRKTMSSDDRIVRQILSTAPVSHKFINLNRPPSIQPDVQGLIEENTYGDHGKRLIGPYRELFPSQEWLNLRGNGLELSRLFQDQVTFEELAEICQGEFPIPVGERLEELGYRDDLHGYSRHLLAYWEFRHGKWLGEIHNELDAAFETWIPAGVRRVRDLMASFPAEEISADLVVRDLIDRNAPELNWPPINAKQNLYQEWRALKLAEVRAPLEDASVVTPDGKSKELSLAKQIQLPADTIFGGTELNLKLLTVKRNGTASFRVLQPYCNEQARGYFRWSILANDVSLFEIDGAETGSPINFTIENLRKGDVVDVKMEFLRSVRNPESWSKASRIAVEAVQFYPARRSGERISLRHDWLAE